MFTYKNYIAQVTFDEEAEIFHGEVINIRDVITFQGTTVAELKKAFRESVEDYLAFCAERNEMPNKPFSGKFNLRLEPELHREIHIAAKRSGKSINQWIAEALFKRLQEKFA